MNRLIRALLAGALVPVAVAVSAVPALAGSHPLTHLLGCNGRALTSPSGEVVLACGDGNVAITGTHWSSWTGSSATGITDLQINLCEPTCAASRISSFSDSTVKLLDVRSTAKGRVFTRAQITYRHDGKTKTITAYPLT
jgi:hypothetical protein